MEGDFGGADEAEAAAAAATGDLSTDGERRGAPMPHAGAREKLRAWLAAHPGGADANELTGLLFKGAGRDPELGARLIHGLLGDHPECVFDAATGLWSLRAAASLKIPLERARFVVVDLETTGGRAAPDSIIEIGACELIGGRVGRSFATLVRPAIPIPRFITRLTSITDEMVAAAPRIHDAIVAFREFLGDGVMVAHNAPFDFSFLDLEFRRRFGVGVRNPVLCTLRLSRRLLPSLKRRRLDALAEHFGLSTDGRHRGWGDARMTAELLSIFLEMAAKMGVGRLDRLIDWNQRGAAGQRIERHVAPEAIAAIPRAPGVYLMRNERGDILYVGKAARLRDRVGAYFNGGAARDAKTAELIGHVHAIETRPARSALDAALHEARLIRELKPPYNRMLKSAAPAYFVKIDLADDFPRIAVARKLGARPGVMHLGPFIGRRNLDNSARALSRLLGLRTCAGRLDPAPDFSPCVYGQMGHCAAPCNQSVAAGDYNDRVRRAIAFLRGRDGPLMGELAAAHDQAARAMRFEEARRRHRELEALAAFSERATRLSRVVVENNLVIVFPARDGDAGQAAVVYVVLAGRLALIRELDSPSAPEEIAAFVAANHDLYGARAVARGETEAMTIVARWLREREPADGRVIHLNGSRLEPLAIRNAAAPIAADPDNSTEKPNALRPPTAQP